MIKSLILLKKTGRICKLRKLNDAEYFQELKNKLVEEVDEFLAADNIEELADIIEVIYALAKFIGHNVNELEELRDKKHLERGGFDKRLFLESIDS